MVALDTNILVRLLVREDEKLYNQANSMIANAKQGSLLLDRLVFNELGYVLTNVYNFKRIELIEIYRALLSDMRFFIPNKEIIADAVGLFERHSSLSLIDCWLLALNKGGEVSGLATLDRDLAKKAAQ